MRDGLGVQERVLGALVACTAKDVLADHDHEHENQLQEAGDEQQEGEWVWIERDDPRLGQRDPADLEDSRQVERPHGADGLGDRCSDVAVETDVLRLDRWRLHRRPLFYPRMGFRLHKRDALVQDSVLFFEVRVQRGDLPKDLLGVFERPLGAPVGASAQNPLADQDDEDQEQLDQVARKAETGTGRDRTCAVVQSWPERSSRTRRRW